MVFPLPMAAQEADVQDAGNTSSWYIGLQGGVPFGISTFSSFGADKTRAGYDLGIHLGYRFNPVLSLEGQAAWGELGQGARDCCAYYWLGSDGCRYEAPVAGMSGRDYSDLETRVAMQRYGLQLNVDLLGFFSRTREGRWSLELSPALSAVGAKPYLRPLHDGDVRMQDTRWHLGAGGNVQAAYRLTPHLRVGIYSGMTWLSGDAMDGLPEYRHEENFIWESGLRLAWYFGGKEEGR